MKPFSKTKVPIIGSIASLGEMLRSYPVFSFCLYLAYKDSQAWQISTSSVYMNQRLENFIYLPVNIPKEDNESLEALYTTAQREAQIIAINQTQPHKSNTVLKEHFRNLSNMPSNVDALVKDREGNFILFDLNGPSFCDWFCEDVATFNNAVVIVVGIGGVGEPIARKIVDYKPYVIHLVSPSNKDSLRSELSKKCVTTYSQHIPTLPKNDLKREVILINAAGKEGAANDGDIHVFLEKYKHMNNIFVDLRPQLEVTIVTKANQLGWRGFTGYGMNARNDYTLLKKIATILHQKVPQFEKFKELVKNAS